MSQGQLQGKLRRKLRPMKLQGRPSVLVILVLVACGGSDGGGGPMAPGVPQVAGAYAGTVTVTVNTCDGETGSNTGEFLVTQSGSAVTFIIAGGVIRGTIDSSGNWTGTATIDVLLNGFTARLDVQGTGMFQGNQFTADLVLDGVIEAEGVACTIAAGYILTRQ